MLYNKAREQVALERLWLLDNTVLTHQPGTQSDADRMSRIIEQKNDMLRDEIMVASYQVTEEKLRERNEADDGYMKIVDN